MVAIVIWEFKSQQNRVYESRIAKGINCSGYSGLAPRMYVSLFSKYLPEWQRLQNYKIEFSDFLYVGF